MDALSSFDTALVCFLNEILLNNIEKHTTSIVLQEDVFERTNEC